MCLVVVCESEVEHCNKIVGQVLCEGLTSS